MNMFIVKKDMCTKCRKHIALTYSTKKKRLINIAFELVVRFHAQAIRPRSEDDNVSHGVDLLGFESCEDLAGRALELLDLDAGLFGEEGGQLVGQARGAGHVDGDIAGKCGGFFSGRGFFRGRLFRLCRGGRGLGGLRLGGCFRSRYFGLCAGRKAQAQAGQQQCKHFLFHDSAFSFLHMMI